jgi:excisionase family DNA binding protein
MAYKSKWRTPPEPAVAVDPVLQPWPQFMDYSTAGRYTCSSYWTIRNLVKDGKLTAKRMGRRYIVSRADLDAFWAVSEPIAPKGEIREAS